MAGRIARALEAGLLIRPGEAGRCALMSLYAANAIGRVVIGHSVRDALYLSNRPARGLAGMYIWSSIAIVLVSWFYARIADRLPRGLLNAASAIGCAALGAALWAILTVTDAVWVYAALYIFVEAMGSLVVIQFWTLANDVFHGGEAKRLFGLIGGGGTLANVIFGLLVGRYAQVIGAQNLLLVMVAQLAICAGLAQAGSRTAAAGALVLRSRPVRKAPVISRAGLTFLSNKHLTIVALIGAVSAAAVTIVDFQVTLSAAAVLDQNDLAGYFGRFYGICGGVALAVQIWVTGRLLERYGILASLLPLPLGLALGSGASAASATPGLFVSSLAKGSDTIFRYTINDASMQLLYVPVAPHVRGRAKAFIDGVLKPTSVAFAGAVLLFYKQSGGRGRPLTAAVLLLVGTWVWLLTRARGEYVRSLVESLERRRLDLSSSQFSRLNEGTMRALRTALGGEPATVLHALTLVRQLAQEADFTPELRSLLRHQDAAVRASALEQLGELRRPGPLIDMRGLLRDPVAEVRAAALGAVCAIEQEAAVATVLPFLDVRAAPEAVVRAAAAVALIRHAGIDGVLAAAEPLKQLLCAEDPRDRGAAADALVSTLTCREQAVRKAAARSLARLARRQRGVRIEAVRVERAVHVELAAARTALSVFKTLPLPAAGHAPRTAAELLGMALLEERDARVLQALVLLEVLLPEVRVDVVAENLRSESAAARGNAIEGLANALPEPWKRQVMANLEETKRRGDQVAPDARPVAELVSALIGGECGPWVAACAARWALDAPLPLARLLPALEAGLYAASAPLREAAARAVARAAPAGASRLLAPLARDPAPSGRRPGRALRHRSAPPASA